MLKYTLHRSGKPDAPRITLVHSLALDRGIWDGVVAELAGEADILTFDCRGHGESPKTPGPYTAEQFAADLRELLGSVGWDRTVVGGASMGGCVALQFAASYPKMLDGLAVIDSSAWYGPDAPKSWHERGQKALSDGLGSMIAFQLTRWFSDAFNANHPDVADRFAKVFLKSDIPAYVASCNMLGNFDFRSKLAAIAVPVEILVGDEDYAAPPDMSRAMEAAIPGSHLTIVAGARHLTPIEIPDQIASMLRTVIARKDGSVANGR